MQKIINLLLLSFIVFLCCKTVFAKEFDTCKILPELSIPTDVFYSIGNDDNKPMVAIDWGSSINPNIICEEMCEPDTSNVNYRVEKEFNGQTINLLIDDTEDGYLNIGGYLIDEAVEWNNTYIYKIYAYDTINYIESEPAVLKVEVKKATDDSCSSDPAIKGTVEELDQSTKVVRLSWVKYCEEDMTYKLFRDEEEILTIKPEELEGYVVGENTIEFIDKDIDQNKEEIEYRVEVWGETIAINKNIFVSTAMAANEEKKTESTIRINIKNGNTLKPTTTPNPPNKLLDWKPKFLPIIPLETLVDKIIAAIYAFAFVLLVIMLIYAGIMYITSSGDEAKTEKAKTIIKFALIGIAIAIFSYGFVLFILNLLR